MTKLTKLKHSAKKTAEFWRRHQLERWSTFDGMAWTQCKVCTANVRVIVKPMPNEINVSGRAVAVNCPR